MIVGIPKEIKNSEKRVGITETGVELLVRNKHTVYIEKDAGLLSGISNQAYIKAGAKIIEDKHDLYRSSDMIVKVKEPLSAEYDLLKENQILYCYLHLANEPELTDILCKKKITSIAYETIEDDQGKTFMLVPMSEIAGKMATQIGAELLLSKEPSNGKGILLGGAVGIEKASVVIVGAGVVGISALKIAVGFGADVTILDIDRNKLEYLDHIYNGKVHTLYSSQRNLEKVIPEADLLIGAVLVTGYKAPSLVTKSMITKMENGSVVIDVSVDQGGCIETCKPTDHENPTFEYEGVIHYCVPNMPGIAPRTSTYALTGATLQYLLMLADNGVENSLKKDPKLIKGINTYNGFVSYEPVALSLGVEYKSIKV